MRVYPKVSGLAAWSENCKWYSSLPVDAVVSMRFAIINLCVASQQVFIVVVAVYFIMTKSRNFWIHSHMCLKHIIAKDQKTLEFYEPASNLGARHKKLLSKAVEVT
jgi:hypothetical protein